MIEYLSLLLSSFFFLYNKASLIGSKNLIKTIELIEADYSYIGEKQPNINISYAKKIFSQDCIINWNVPSLKIYNKIRALSPKPGAYTFIQTKRLKIFKSIIINKIELDDSTTHLVPGYIYIYENKIYVKTLDSFLSLIIVQLEGKKRMDAKSFLKGNQIKLIKLNSAKS